jgi:hypothetical protein
MTKNFSRTIPAIAAVLCLLVAVAEFYQVRELFAALAIFAVLFGTLATAFLILFLIEKKALKGVTGLEVGMARVRARRAAVSAPPRGDSRLRSPRWN